jgi:hypothetical protein
MTVHLGIVPGMPYQRNVGFFKWADSRTYIGIATTNHNTKRGAVTKPIGRASDSPKKEAR